MRADDDSMTCPGCGVATRVEKTTASGPTTVRYVICPGCNKRGKTEEKFVAWDAQGTATNRKPPTHGWATNRKTRELSDVDAIPLRQERLRDVSAKNGRVASGVLGGLGGSESGSGSDLVPISSPPPSVAVDPERARVGAVARVRQVLDGAVFIASDSAVGTLAEAARAAGIAAREACVTTIAGAPDTIALALRIGAVGVAVEVDDARPRKRTLLKLGAMRAGVRVVLLRHAPRGPVVSDAGMDLVYGLGLERAAAQYTQGFEAFWTAIGRGPGNKQEAFEEYRRAGTLDPGKVAFAWKAYVASLPRDQVERGAIRHVCRWLKTGGHLQDYGPPRLVAAGGFVPSDYPEFD